MRRLFTCICLLLMFSINSLEFSGKCLNEIKCKNDHLYQTRAFVLSFTAETRESSTNILKALALTKSKIIVNVVYQKEDLKSENIESEFFSLLENLKSNGLKINIIQLGKETKPPVYIRDIGLFTQNKINGDISAYSFPYKEEGIIGPPIVKEMAKQCKFDFRPTFQVDTRDIKSMIPAINNYSVDQRGSLMGGNLLFGPGNILIAGSPEVGPFAKDHIQFLEKKFKFKAIRTPSIGVGHIDELLNFVNDPKTNCGFSILKASPAEALKFLKTRNKNEILTATDNQDSLWEDSFVSDEYLQVYKTYVNLSQKLSEKMLAGKNISPAELLELGALLKKKAIQDKNFNITVGDILNNRELINDWKELDKEIDFTLYDVLSFIEKTLKKKCAPKIIPLPVFVNNQNEVFIPNPVNGENLDAYYLFSAQNRLSYTSKVYWDEKEKKFLIGPRKSLFSELNQQIEKTIKEQTGLIPLPIDTFQYDDGDGNLHCATNTIKQFCQ